MYEYLNTIKEGFPYPQCKFALFEEYIKIFGDRIEDQVNLLELGVFKGASVKFWSEFYLTHPESKIIGVDTNPRGIYNNKVKLYKCSQGDTEELIKIVKENNGFDIVIDDCSHDYDLTLHSFTVLWKFLAPGGYYVIEDWTVIQKRGSLLIYDLLYNIRYSEINLIFKRDPHISIAFLRKG